MSQEGDIDQQERIDKRNPDVQQLYDHLVAAIGMQPAGSANTQRRYAYNLMRRMAKAYPDHSPVAVVKALIDKGRATYWRSHITCFRWLFYNYPKVIEEIKAKQPPPTSNYSLGRVDERGNRTY